MHAAFVAQFLVNVLAGDLENDFLDTAFFRRTQPTRSA